MMSLSHLHLALSAAVVGILAHVLYFRKGEHHLQGPFYTKLAAKAIITMVVIQIFVDRSKAVEVAGLILALHLAFIVAASASTIIYRLFFHPLRRFSGPVPLKITKLAHVVMSRRLDNCKRMQALQEQYGDIVRTGPNELTFFTVDAFNALYGPGSKCTRGPWYDMHLPRASVTGLRELAPHAQRRRVWDHAFSIKAVSQYERRVLSHVSELEDYLTKHKGYEVDMSRLSILFTFDVMGDVAFGAQLAGVTTGKTHSAVQIMRMGLAPLSFFAPTPWLWHLIVSIPGANKPWIRLNDWAKKELRKRMKAEPAVPDIFHWLLDFAKTEGNVKEQMLLLEGDAVTSVVAGSDTTASALTFLLYNLAKSPAYIERIKTELDTIADCKDDKALQGLTVLNACITETLRLHPTVTGALPRDTPAEGLHVGDGLRIPGGVTCISLIYSMHRLQSSYPDPKRFVPERWTGEASHMLGEKYVYAPFNLGRFRCVASRLALMELRLACAMVVKRFDFEFARGAHGGREVLDDFRDMITACPGSLRLVFRQRN